MTQAEFMKTLRTENNYTQGEFAGLLGLERTSVVNKEAGRQAITAVDIEYLSKIFGIEIYYNYKYGWNYA